MAMRHSSELQQNPGKTRSPHSFWILTLLAFLATLALTATANIVADPFGIYGTGRFPPVTINQYKNKRELFSNYLPPPSSLIIGSSRVQCLDPDLVTRLTGMRCFNWELPGSKTEMDYAVLRMAIEEFNAPIEMVIVGIEPEAFQPDVRIDPQARLTPGYMAYFQDDDPWGILADKTERLFSMDQFSVSSLVLTRALLGLETKYWITWGPDGFAEVNMENRPDYVIPDPERRLQVDIETYSEQRWKIDEFTGLSEQRKFYWEEFLRICDENDIDVIAFMPPDHPELINKLDNLGAGPLRDEAYRYVEQTVTAIGGTCVNCSDLETFGGLETQFRDAIHMTPDNGALLLRHLFTNYEPVNRESSGFSITIHSSGI